MSDNDNFHVRIKPHFSVIAHSGNAVELRSGVWNPTSCMLTDENNDDKLLKIIKALDGTRSLKEISKNLSISRTEIESVIDHLQQMGAIETTPSSVFDLYLQQASPSLHTSNIIESNVTPKWPILLMGDNTLVQSVSTLLQQFMSKNFFDVLTHTDERFQLLNDLDEDFMHHGLEFENVVELFKPWQGHCLVYVQKHINPFIALKLNRILHALQIPWIHAALDGPFILIGPTFTHNLPCYECFEARVSMNIKDHVSYQKYKAALANKSVINRENFHLDPILQNLLASHVCMEVANFCLTGCSFTQRKVLSIYLPTMEISFNEFLRYSHCKTCGSDNLRDAAPLYFDFNSLLETA